MATRTMPQYEGGRLAYCQKCGLWVTVFAENVKLKYCPQCKTPTLIENCQQCGAALPAGVRSLICLECGESLSGIIFEVLAQPGVEDPSTKEIIGLKKLAGKEGEGKNWLDLKRLLFARYAPIPMNMSIKQWREVAAKLGPEQLASVTVENLKLLDAQLAAEAEAKEEPDSPRLIVECTDPECADHQLGPHGHTSDGPAGG